MMGEVGLFANPLTLTLSRQGRGDNGEPLLLILSQLRRGDDL